MNKAAIWDGLKARFKRAEPLLMVKFPNPPGPKRLRGYDMARIHPFMSQAEVSRAAGVILGVIEDTFNRGIARTPSEMPLDETHGSMWDHSLDYSAYSRDGQPMLQAVKSKHINDFQPLNGGWLREEVAR